MFPSFTGSARPRRQVNLSGRNHNPFATLPGSRASPSPQTAQNALVQAQQDRISRQQERQRPPAATRIQRSWRGYKERRELQRLWRQEWDHLEGLSTVISAQTQTQISSIASPAPAAYHSVAECLKSLRLLVQFASPRNTHDVQRLSYFSSRYLGSISIQSSAPSVSSAHPFLRLAKIILDTLTVHQSPPFNSHVVDNFLTFLRSIVPGISTQLAPYAQIYFRTLARIAKSGQSTDFELLSTAAVTLLQAPTSKITIVYEGFVCEFLTTPELPNIFGSFELFAQGVKYEILAEAISRLLSSSPNTSILHLKNREELLWLLAYFIYLRRSHLLVKYRRKDLPDMFYVNIVSTLISFLADDIGSRMDTSSNGISENTDMSTLTALDPKPLPTFVRSEILTLINQENVSSLLANIDVTLNSEGVVNASPNEASVLASFALTLLRAFPRRGDEIRMWLYRGSTSRQSKTAPSGESIPAIKYFYEAASKTKIFEFISKNPRETVSMLQRDKHQNLSLTSPDFTAVESKDQQWRVILLFLELYTFVLKVMDDEEFLSGTVKSNEEWSWTRQSALPLDQVKYLTVFLKNLAFSMYWNVSEIAGIEATNARMSLAEYFGGIQPAQNSSKQDGLSTKYSDLSVAGVSGMTLAYMKGMVTGVLRMIYERE